MTTTNTLKSALLTLVTLAIAVSTISGCQQDTDLLEGLARYDIVDFNTKPISPQIGQWRYDSMDIQSRSCSNITEHLALETGFKLTSQGSYFNKMLDNMDTFSSCETTGANFSCEALTESIVHGDYSVTLDVALQARGLLWDETSLEGLYEINIECTGLGCSLAEMSFDVQFPCHIGAFYTASWA